MSELFEKEFYGTDKQNESNKGNQCPNTTRVIFLMKF